MNDPNLPVGLPPVLLDAVVEIVHAMFAQFAQSQSRGFTVAPSVLRVGTVVSSDPASGTVNVLLDDDLASSSTATLATPGTPCVTVGVTPVVGGRALVEFAPGGAAFCIGTIGPGSLVLDPTVDVSLASDGHPLQIGRTDGLNVAYDENEVQARNNGTYSPFTINNQGGDVRLASVLLVGNPGGYPSGAHAYLAPFQGGPTHWTTLTYAAVLTADGRVILNAVGSGNYVDLRALDSTVMARFTTNSTPNTVLTFPAGIQSLAGTVAVITSGNQLAKQPTSSIRIKHAVETADLARLADAALALRPVTFAYNTPVHPFGDEPLHVGLIAEEVAEAIPSAALWGPDPDEPPLPYEDGWEPPDDDPGASHPDHQTRPAHTAETLTLSPVVHDYADRAVIPHLVALCKRQQAEIDALTARLDALNPA